MTELNATIIGAGIIGVSTAAFLQRSGYKVTIIDRVGPGEGCSFGNAGGIAFAEIVPSVHPRILMKIPGWLMDPLGPLTVRWSYLPQALPWFLAMGRNAMPDRVRAITEARAALALRAVADFETLLNATGAIDLIKYQDTLRVFDSERQFLAEAGERETKKSFGYEMKRLSGDEVRELEPAIGPNVHCGAFHGGWYFVTNPERVVKSIAAGVLRNGGTILADSVEALERNGGLVTHLRLKDRGRVGVGKLVICAGAYSHFLAKQLGENILLEAERGYHMVLPNSGISLSRSITYARTPGAATPMEMGCASPERTSSRGSMRRPTMRAPTSFGVFSRLSFRAFANRTPPPRGGWGGGRERRIRFPSSDHHLWHPMSGMVSATATWG